MSKRTRLSARIRSTSGSFSPANALFETSVLRRRRAFVRRPGSSSEAVSGIEGNRNALARAGALVRSLERQGLPSERLSTGFLPDFAGKARIHFTLEVEVPAEAAGAEAR